MQPQFKVESGIPFKGKFRKLPGIVPLETMYPVKTMNVGDSFFVPGFAIKISTVQVGISRINKRGLVDGQFKHVPVVENEVAGSRVWRVS